MLYEPVLAPPHNRMTEKVAFRCLADIGKETEYEK
jgi:hypothetical protein